MPFAPRAPYDWHLRTRSLALGPRTLILAILNVTPDSFSDGGRFNSPEAALAQALLLLDQGADVIDLGGESTRPNATPISPNEEQARVLPVLEAILKARPATVVSIDTFHAATARAAVEAGAEIVNDVSGHLWDPLMSATCASLACGTILMHTRGTPQTWHTLPPLAPEAILPLVLEGLAERLATATAAGISRNRIVLDPGFGFGKLGPENFTLLARLESLRTLDLPILAGLSRKRFLTHPVTQPTPTRAVSNPNELTHTNPEELTHTNPSDRIRTNPEEQTHASPGDRTPNNPGAPCPDLRTWDTAATLSETTLAAHTAAILAGAHLLRVHDVPAARHAAAIADTILNSSNRNPLL